MNRSEKIQKKPLQLSSYEDLLGLSGEDENKSSSDVIQYIDTKFIKPYPFNNLDISNIDDIESSIKNIGFTSPIEVTTYGCDEGYYMLLSGHRRFATWTSMHEGEPIKCIVVDRDFKNEREIEEYVLSSNAQRHLTIKELVDRYLRFEKLIQEKKKDGLFDGNVREEVAKCMGLSVQNADRYKSISKLIPEILQLVEEEKLGLSTATYIAPHSEYDQKKIYKVLSEAIDAGVNITRTLISPIIRYVLEGKESWAMVETLINQKKISDMSTIGLDKNNDRETPDKDPLDRRNEIRREFDPIAANADAADKAEAEYEYNHHENYDSETGTFIDDVQETSDGDFDDVDDVVVADSDFSSDLSNEEKNANNIYKLLLKLEDSLNQDFKFDAKELETVLNKAQSTISSIEEHIINPILNK